MGRFYRGWSADFIFKDDIAGCDEEVLYLNFNTEVSYLEYHGGGPVLVNKTDPIKTEGGKQLVAISRRVRQVHLHCAVSRITPDTGSYSSG